MHVLLIYYYADSRVRLWVFCARVGSIWACPGSWDLAFQLGMAHALSLLGCVRLESASHLVVIFSPNKSAMTCQADILSIESLPSRVSFAAMH